MLLQRGFEHGFEHLRAGYQAILAVLMHWRLVFVPLFLLACLSAFLLYPWLGQDFFPVSDTGQFKLHMRAKTGTRIEETARLCDLVEQSIRRQIPRDQLLNVLDEIGLPYSSINTIYSNSAPVGSADADIMVALTPDHRPTEEFVRMLRTSLPQEFPGAEFYFLPDDIVSQILNFGLPAPIDVQIVGKDVNANRELGIVLMDQMRHIPGIADLRIQQTFDEPKLHVITDRTKAAESGYTQNDVAQSLLISLSGSFQTQPTFWLSPQNGVSYSVVTQAPQYDVQSLQALRNLPLTVKAGTAEILNDVTSITRGEGMASVNHYDIQRTIDIFGAADGRDLGSVGAEIDRVVAAARSRLVRGSEIRVRGQVDTMRKSFAGLVAGLAFAIVLVYLLIVVNFQSWLDPFIIITALPAALAGIVLMLVFHSHYSQRAGDDGRDYVHGRRHRQQHSGDQLCERAAHRRLRPRPRRHGRGIHALPSRDHDGARHDHRHGSDGARIGRRRRAKCAARPRGDRRINACDRLDAGLRSGRIRNSASTHAA